MKYIQLYIVILLSIPFALLGQKKVSIEIENLKVLNAKFHKINILEIDNSFNRNENNSVVSSSTYASLNLIGINEILENRYNAIEIEVPFDNKSISIELYRVNIFTENFKLNTDKLVNVNYNKGAHYRGIIKGNNNSIASFNFFENEMNGIVSSKEYGNINIGKLLSKTKYIIYSDNDLLVKPKFICNTTNTKNKEYHNEVVNRNLSTEKCVTSYFEVGYQAYNANGNDIVATANWITSIFNNAQTLFDNDGISITLKTIFIWTIEDYFSTSSNFILPAFANARPSFDGDVGFIADIDPAALGGQASAIDGLCNDGKFAYGDLDFNYASVPTYSQPVLVVTHELGHVLGSHHTFTCVWNGNNTAIDGCVPAYGGCPTPVTEPNAEGTIMSYCVHNFSLGFGEQPANAIIQNINNSSCLGLDCVNSCINTIGFINIENVTQNNALISWTDSNVNNQQWEISIVPVGSEPIWSIANVNSYSVNNLLPNNYYEVNLKSSCSTNLSYPKHSLIFATQGEDNCGGTIISDTGGLTQGYGSNEHIIRTIVPNIPNKKIKLTFNNLNLFSGAWLFIYDGIGTNETLLNKLSTNDSFFSYGFGNSFYPFGFTFESQDPSGALTLEFVSPRDYFNQVGSNRGWKATVSCLDNLGNEDYSNGFYDYSYGINYITQQLNIASKDFINKVEIYSIDGKLAVSKNNYEKDFFVDISSLSNSTYIIKLFFEKGSTSFKILK